MFKLTLLLFAILAVSFAERARYDNYRVYRLIPDNEQKLKVLYNLEHGRQGIDFWTGVRQVNVPVDIMVPPHKFAWFHEFLLYQSFKYEIQIPNVQELVEIEAKHNRHRPKAFGWNNYYDLDEIYGWLATLEAENPGVVTQVVGGTSYEKREIRGIEINFNENNPGVYFESGIHAREWIGPAASSWIINEILNSPADSIWRRFNYLYFPSVNPDGFSYTVSSDRLWRKTRKPYQTSWGLCHGADPNRNWDNHWLEAGTSTFACDETYGGPRAFSEIETKSLSEYLEKVGSRYDITVAFHSYSQLLMFPWGYTGVHAPLHDLWQRIGDKAAADLYNVNGLTFQVGNIHDTVYPASGSSLEWFYGIFNNTLAYTFECRDTGRYGFVLPADQIIPAGKELQAAIRRFLVEYEDLKK